MTSYSHENIMREPLAMPKVYNELLLSGLNKYLNNIYFKKETIMLSDSLVISQMSWSSCDRLEKFLHDFCTSAKKV